jgi:predicted O-linked N-acetylglucosamine transferase (SPINDLY family)
MLDSLHYNAHTTATDALWAGVPIVTLPGAYSAHICPHSALSRATERPDRLATR